MIALPFHPSNAMPIREFLADLPGHLAVVEKQGRKIKGPHGEPFSIMDHIRDGGFYPDQALVSGCAGGMFENFVAMADILKGCGIRADQLNLQANPSSLPVQQELTNQGIAAELAVAGVTMRAAICGPCFGVTDVPANNQISIRHVTRNYSTREGTKPTQGQMAAVCLMDARSIAATVRNGGRLIPATDLDVEYRALTAGFDARIYENQVFDSFDHADPAAELVMGPNIADWPQMYPIKEHLLLQVAGSYQGSITTDDLMPSGEASSYRSNPERLSGFAMASRDPDYVPRARAIRAQETEINGGEGSVSFGSVMLSDQIGDGSSREQAASCQKVLGGFANLAGEYATKRYRSNCINWGLLPLRTEEKLSLPVGTWLYIEHIGRILAAEESAVMVRVLDIPAQDSPLGIIEALRDCTELEKLTKCIIPSTLDALTKAERDILAAGGLINYYKKQNERECK